jgi:hypothetical protein
VKGGGVELKVNPTLVFVTLVVESNDSSPGVVIRVSFENVQLPETILIGDRPDVTPDRVEQLVYRVGVGELLTDCLFCVDVGATYVTHQVRLLSHEGTHVSGTMSGKDTGVTEPFTECAVGKDKTTFGDLVLVVFPLLRVKTHLEVSHFSLDNLSIKG